MSDDDVKKNLLFATDKVGETMKTTLDPKQRWQSAADFWQSLTIANKFAAYQVANGGTNFRRPIAIGMATTSASVGRLTKTRMMPRSKISGPLARCRVTTT